MSDFRPFPRCGGKYEVAVDGSVKCDGNLISPTLVDGVPCHRLSYTMTDEAGKAISTVSAIMSVEKMVLRTWVEQPATDSMIEPSEPSESVVVEEEAPTVEPEPVTEVPVEDPTPEEPQEAPETVPEPEAEVVVEEEPEATPEPPESPEEPDVVEETDAPAEPEAEPVVEPTDEPTPAAEEVSADPLLVDLDLSARALKELQEEDFVTRQDVVDAYEIMDGDLTKIAGIGPATAEEIVSKLGLA